MNLSVVTTPEADAQIRAIDVWWRENRAASPDLFIDELSDAFDLVAGAPHLGRADGLISAVGRPTVDRPESNLVMRRLYIWLVLAMLNVWTTAGAQVALVPPDALISLERTSCGGPCPIYSVRIDSRGTVTYEGKQFVRVAGRATRQITPAAMAALLARAEQIGFFAMRDRYREIEFSDGTVTTVTDFPTKIVSVTANGRTKRIENYVAGPDALEEFEREIDNAANTKRWVFIDEAALEDLARTGWSAAGEEGATLLQKAIERDDVPIARRLIQLGADLDGPKENRLPPLISARSGGMVNLLVRAGADPHERPVGRVGAQTPLMTTAYKDAAVAEALLKAGARLEDVADGWTALWYAACRGNRPVVGVLLNAGANPRGAASGMSAVDCARRARADESNRRRTVLDRGRPTVADFDQVIAQLEAAEKRTP